jgi:hypothetical protein
LGRMVCVFGASIFVCLGPEHGTTVRARGSEMGLRKLSISIQNELERKSESDVLRL